MNFCSLLLRSGSPNSQSHEIFVGSWARSCSDSSPVRSGCGKCAGSLLEMMSPTRKEILKAVGSKYLTIVEFDNVVC